VSVGYIRISLVNYVISAQFAASYHSNVNTFFFVIFNTFYTSKDDNDNGMLSVHIQ